MSLPEEQQAAAILTARIWALTVLKAARVLALPDWAIGAGFVRSLIWDALLGSTTQTTPDDIDLVYFDPTDISHARESALQRRLADILPAVPWSVRNQARMHLRNGDARYRDTADAIAHWLETPTAVAVRLEPDNALTWIAPHGLTDLLTGRIRPTPSGQMKLDDDRRRVRDKGWLARWPQLSAEALI